MTIEEIRERILHDDTFVKSEISKIEIYYNLKRTTRYYARRSEGDVTESVAEHIYALHILCDYFAPLHQDLNLDFLLVKKILTWHDMAEAIVGDMTSYTKTENHKQAELEAEIKLCKEATEHIKSDLEDVFSKMQDKTCMEANFAKALDKVEPLFHLTFLSHTPSFRPFNLGWTAADTAIIAN